MSNKQKEPSSRTSQRYMYGVLLGTAVGDALGLAAEGLSPQRIQKWYPNGWHHRLLGRWDMVSDDTDHTVFVTQALIAHPDDVEAFGSRLARSLRWWLVSLPAGIGLGTARAILKLWLGFAPHKSGVFTAGNGPAMRIAPLGVMFAHHPEKLTAYVTTSTKLTHTDPKALVGALAVARTVAWVVRDNLREPPALLAWIQMLRGCGPDDTTWQELIDLIQQHASQGSEVSALVEAMGLSRGVTGYMYHTVPLALYAWYRHFGNYEATVTSALYCGGDTDTVGAIAGAMAGAVAGADGIPREWVENLRDWPHHPGFLEKLSERISLVMESQQPGTPLRVFWPGVVLRNLVFLGIVLIHGFRRLLPPY